VADKKDGKKDGKNDGKNDGKKDGKKGDDDKDKKKGGGGVVLLAALVVVLGGLGLGTKGGPDPLAKPRTSTQTDRAKQAAGSGQPEEMWRRMGLTPVRQVIEGAVPCVANATGQVRDYLRGAPCLSLHRALFLVGDGSGDLILVSVVWVRLPGPGAVAALRSIEDRGGSGDVTPIAGSRVGAGDVRFAAAHYGSRPAGSSLVVAETEAAGGRPDDALLDQVAGVAAALTLP
jgi:hypothetical protein